MRSSVREDGSPTVGAGEAEIHGAVLCGGASRRMGGDKALMPLGGRPMLQHAIQVLSELTPRVFLASGRGPRYTEFGLLEVPDRFQDAGPLAGLEAALTHVESHSSEAGRAVLCVLACDMPRARRGVFEQLLRGLGGHDAAILCTPRGREPLFGVYGLSALESVRRALAEGRRRVDSFFGEIRLNVLDDLGLTAEDAAINVNTPEEYRLEQGS